MILISFLMKDYLMLRKMKVLLSACILSFATQSYAVEIDYGCGANCVSAVKSGSSLIYTWYSEDGSPVKSFLVELPENAVAVSSEISESVSKADTTFDFDGGKGRVEYSTDTYETETEYVIVSTMRTYNGRGILISVVVNTTRIPIGRARNPK